jgi:hypothetical protein
MIIIALHGFPVNNVQEKIDLISREFATESWAREIVVENIISEVTNIRMETKTYISITTSPHTPAYQMDKRLKFLFGEGVLIMRLQTA